MSCLLKIPVWCSVKIESLLSKGRIWIGWLSTVISNVLQFDIYVKLLSFIRSSRIEMYPLWYINNVASGYIYIYRYYRIIRNTYMRILIEYIRIHKIWRSFLYDRKKMVVHFFLEAAANGRVGDFCCYCHPSVFSNIQMVASIVQPIFLVH